MKAWATDRHREYLRLHINDDIRRVQRLFRWAASEQLIPVTVPQSLETVDGLRKGETKAKEYPRH